MKMNYKILYFFLCILLTITLSSCTELGFKRTKLSGEIVILADKVLINKEIPLALIVPGEIDELHKEMWEAIYIDENGNEQLTVDEIIECDSFENIFSNEELELLFLDSPINIENKNPKNPSFYSPRVAILRPNKIGKYKINIMGYYKTTSPRPVTSIEIIVE